MRKCKVINPIFLSAILLTSTAIAAANEAQTAKIFNDFQTAKTNFLTSKVAKKDFARKFKNLDADLNTKYTQLKIAEAEDLSIEGNQAALDLELLEPLRKLANSKINKNTCTEAIHLNALNSTQEEKTQIKTIENVITTLCK